MKPVHAPAASLTGSAHVHLEAIIRGDQGCQSDKPVFRKRLKYSRCRASSQSILWEIAFHFFSPGKAASALFRRGSPSIDGLAERRPAQFLKTLISSQPVLSRRRNS